MKANDQFQFSATWWKENKPLTIDEGLGKALKTFEKAEATYLGSKTITNFVAVMGAIDAVDTARKNAIAKCGKLNMETKAALENDAVIGLRRTTLAKGLIATVKLALEKYETKATSISEDFAKQKVRLAELKKMQTGKDQKAWRKAVTLFGTNLAARDMGDLMDVDSYGSDVTSVVASLLRFNLQTLATPLTTRLKPATAKLKAARVIRKECMEYAKEYGGEDD
jgi:hypothetical protein